LRAEILLLPTFIPSSPIGSGVIGTNDSFVNMHNSPMPTDAACSTEFIAENLARIAAGTNSNGAVQVASIPGGTIEVDSAVDHRSGHDDLEADFPGV
jgi:hypothetical protein